MWHKIGLLICRIVIIFFAIIVLIVIVQLLIFVFLVCAVQHVGNCSRIKFVYLFLVVVGPLNVLPLFLDG